MLHGIMGMNVVYASAVKRKEAAKRNKLLSQLKCEIECSESEMDNAIRNFNYVTEPEMVDFYIHRLRAEQSRYGKLICEYRRLQEE